jgi:pyruvate/2-oxoacid:ferredoxin oxidoreductase alpha subunit
VAGQFAAVIREQAGIASDRFIRRYDGRPFEPSELAQKIKEMM